MNEFQVTFVKKIWENKSISQNERMQIVAVSGLFMEDCLDELILFSHKSTLTECANRSNRFNNDLARWTLVIR